MAFEFLKNWKNERDNRFTNPDFQRRLAEKKRAFGESLGSVGDDIKDFFAKDLVRNAAKSFSKSSQMIGGKKGENNMGDKFASFAEFTARTGFDAFIRTAKIAGKSLVVLYRLAGVTYSQINGK